MKRSTVGDNRRNIWSEEQDEAIAQLVATHGTKKWAIIAKEMEDKHQNWPKRTGKQIRERWNNHLNPDIKKGPITLEEGVRIFNAHYEYGNKWAEITTQLPGRTDNTVKNYFYATVRRHCRKLNKCLRNAKFCEIFNVAQQQIKVNFLIDALETGDLDYYKIRKIENKELLDLSKKKSGNLTAAMDPKDAKIMKTLDGKSKPMDKNLPLLKSMLDLIEVDLSYEENDSEKDKQSQTSDRARVLKRFKQESQFQKSSEVSQNDFKRFKAEDSAKEEVKSEQSDDVNFHEIPMGNSFQRFDMMDKQSRMARFQEIYRKRRAQKMKGKPKQKLEDFTKLIFSYPKMEIGLNQRAISLSKNDLTFDNIQRSTSRMEFLNDSGKPSFVSKLSIDPDAPKDENKEMGMPYKFNIVDTPNYTVEDNVFTYRVPPNLDSEKNSTKTANFSFMNESRFAKSPADGDQRKGFYIPTPTMQNAFGASFKPGISPSGMRGLNEMGYLGLQTPYSDAGRGMMFQKQTHINPLQNLNKIFAKDHHADNSPQKEQNDQKSEKPQTTSSKPKGLELDMDAISGNNMGGGGYRHPSPLNFPQSCTSNDVFPPNTPGDKNYFLDSTKGNYRGFGGEAGRMPNFGIVSPSVPYIPDSQKKGKVCISPNSGFKLVNKSKLHGPKTMFSKK